MSLRDCETHISLDWKRTNNGGKLKHGEQPA